ncbi:Hypothetical protein, putative, partial [Bodo saltans]
MTWAITAFQDCVRLISGGGNTTATFNESLASNNSVTVVVPEISWDCNLWNQRSLTRSGIRALLSTIPAIYATPQIDSRYGNDICRSDSLTLAVSDSPNSHTISSTRSATISNTATESLNTTATGSDSKTIALAQTSSLDSTASVLPTNTTTVCCATYSSSASVSTSTSVADTATVSPTASVSPTTTDTHSHTETDSPTISIDPCNTTFRDDSDGFIRHATVLTDITQPGSDLHRNETAATFLTIDRVAFATAKSLRVMIGFNTYLRNFY